MSSGPGFSGQSSVWPPRGPLRRSRSWWKTVIVVAVLLLIFCLLWYLTSLGMARRERFKAEQQVREQGQIARLASAEAPNPVTQQLYSAAVKMKRAKLIAELEDVEVALAEWEMEEKAWEASVPPLETNEGGKRIAADPSLLRTYRAILGKQRPTRTDRLAAAEQAEIFIGPVRQIVDDPAGTSLPPDSILDAVAEFKANIRDSATRLRELRGAIESLANSTKVHGTTTLKDAIPELVKQEDAERAREIARAKKLVDDETTKKLAEIEADKARRLGAEKIKLAQQDARLKEEQARKERLHRLASDPNIRARFSPFLAKGRFNFAMRPSNNYFMDRTGPPSLTAIRAGGYVADLRSFARTMAGEPYDAWFNPRNDRRPVYKPPRSDGEWGNIEQLYELFNELAPIWVEQGVLAK